MLKQAYLRSFRGLLRGILLKKLYNYASMALIGSLVN